MLILFYFIKIIFFEKNTGILTVLDSDQAQHFVGPDLGPNCLQMLSADCTLVGRDNLYVLNKCFLFNLIHKWSSLKYVSEYLSS